MAKKKQDRSTYGMIDLNKLDKEQQELYEKYNPDNIFKTKEQNTVVEDKEVPNSLSMVEYKKTNFIKKLLSKIRSLLKN